MPPLTFSCTVGMRKRRKQLVRRHPKPREWIEKRENTFGHGDWKHLEVLLVECLWNCGPIGRDVTSLAISVSKPPVRMIVYYFIWSIMRVITMTCISNAMESEYLISLVNVQGKYGMFPWWCLIEISPPKFHFVNDWLGKILGCFLWCLYSLQCLFMHMTNVNSAFNRCCSEPL